jgi:hypothetical protein
MEYWCVVLQVIYFIYNMFIGEIQLVEQHVQRLLDAGIESDTIAIISPYAQQVCVRTK